MASVTDQATTAALEEALQKLPKAYRGRRGATALWVEGYIAGKLAAEAAAETDEVKHHA